MSMRLIQKFLQSQAVQTVIGTILFIVTVLIIAYLGFVAIYWIARKMAEEDAAVDLERHKQRLDNEYERYRCQLQEEFEEYKRNLHIETSIDIIIEKGVGYSDSENDTNATREHRIQRIV